MTSLAPLQDPAELARLSIFTRPVLVLPDPPELIRAADVTTEEFRLREFAERVPLKIRWRRSWTPAQLVTLARRSADGRGIPWSQEEQLCVNFLRHEKTAYDRIISRENGSQQGSVGRCTAACVIVKRRIHEAIARDYCWLAEEAERQYLAAAHRSHRG